MTDIKDKIAGKAKRLVGELAGRPDKVLEGEAQETGRPEEGAELRRDDNKPSGPATRREN